MAYVNPAQAGIVEYKQLLFYHLGNISKVAGHLVLQSEDQHYLAQEPEQAYYQAVRTLDAFLTPYWDEEYFADRKILFDGFKDEKVKKFAFAVNLLSVAMKLMFRKQWLILEDIEVGRDEELDIQDIPDRSEKPSEQAVRESHTQTL